MFLRLEAVEIGSVVLELKVVKYLKGFYMLMWYG